MEIIDFLRKEGIDEALLRQVTSFRSQYSNNEDTYRIPQPAYLYYGREVWEKAITALVSGENILLVGPKATGKNVLAENLSALFGRPEWDISFYLNIDASSLIGTDTFKNGEVSFRPGPVFQCAEAGGFGILDEINMAKNEALAVLHATLDFRRIIDVPGYNRISLHPATRFIATMNYGYAGTREINEALASRFMVINMPVITKDNLQKLICSHFENINPSAAEQFALLFQDIRDKCDSSEITTKALDLRGLLSSISLVGHGLNVKDALEMGIVNKSFDAYERQIVSDIIQVRIPSNFTKEVIFKTV